MITEIKINNFKSVQDLTLPLGRFNVLIGANGSGKSNILEAIAFGSAASADKLDNEFLGSRGIRQSTAELTKSAFLKKYISQPIFLNFHIGDRHFDFTINTDESPILKWKIGQKTKLNNDIKDVLVALVKKDFSNDIFERLPIEGDFTKFEIATKNRTDTEINELIKKIESSYHILEEDNIVKDIFIASYYDDYLNKYIIYSPELTSLRNFEAESQIKPLGIKGEGLFSILQIFYENENYGEETINELRKHLHIIEWFDDFEAVFDKVSGRSSLVVKDRNLPNVTLNQHNVNEGFLFLLFYISLIISKETPAFFAIDNIEASFHPKLCEELIKNMVELAKKHNKQIILTTHNPFVLDGLDLNDPEQKLFVVERNADGETIANNINKAPKNILLSEAWMRGRIGGNPETIE